MINQFPWPQPAHPALPKLAQHSLTMAKMILDEKILFIADET